MNLTSTMPFDFEAYERFGFKTLTALTERLRKKSMHNTIMSTTFDKFLKMHAIKQALFALCTFCNLKIFAADHRLLLAATIQTFSQQSDLNV